MIQFWSCWCAEVRRLFWLVVVTVLLLAAVPVSSLHAETIIVPLGSVRSWYDTNVFRRPKPLLTNGEQPEDFVTQVGAGLDILHKTRDIDADVKLGGFFTAYVENSQRNFFSATVRGHVGLDHWVDQYVRDARLKIIQNLRYTPEQESFLTGARELQGDDGLVRGIEGFRATQIRNTTEVKGVYPLSRDVSIEGGYIFGLRSIGRIQGGDVSNVAYFDTMVHTWSGGPRYKLTRNDSVAVLYQQSFITQSNSLGGRTFNANLITVAGDYTKEFQEWGFTIQGGVTFIEPGGRAFPSGRLEINTSLERDTVVYLTLSREGRPSFFLAGGAIISNLARVGFSHRIYERLTLDGGVGYAYNELFPSTDRTFKNLTATSRLAYKLTRNITGELFYLYSNIDVDSSSTQFQYSRSQAGLMLTAEWK